MRFPDVRYVPDKHDFLAGLCANHRVLHIGCADGRADLDCKLTTGRLLHARLAERAAELWGCDFDEPALERLRNHCGFEHLIVADAQNLEAEDFGNAKFDLVIAAELIEHLPNPGQFLTSVKSLLAPNGQLCLTTPNGALSLKTFLHSFRGVEQVSPDHVALFSFVTLSRLLEHFGYRRLRWFTVLERHGSERNRLANTVLQPLVKRFPFYADGLICLASPEQLSSNGA